MTTEPSLLGVLWPNSWRAGLQFLSGYLVSIVNAFLCTKIFKLSGYADYGLSVQVAGIVSGMAAVWTAVKWPLVGQYRTQQNYEALRRVLWPRVWLQAGTFILLAVAAGWLGPVLLKWHGSGKQLLPLEWFTLLLLASFMDLQFSFWTTLLSTENRIPSLWPTVITNLCTVVVVLPLINFTAPSCPPNQRIPDLS